MNGNFLLPEKRREDLQVLRVEPDDSLNAGVVSFLEETGTLVLVSQGAEERFVLQLADNAHLQGQNINQFLK